MRGPPAPIDPCRGSICRDKHEWHAACCAVGPALVRPGRSHHGTCILKSPLFDDEAFDRYLPRHSRLLSGDFWTPVAVAARAAEAFAGMGVRRVLDVGSGPGKFCVAASRAAPGLEIHGVELKPHLAKHALHMARKFEVNKVRFFLGDATSISWALYDGLYFFNPFSGNALVTADRVAPISFGPELERVEHQLARAPMGTVLVTYHGLGGPIPASYELIADEPAGSDRVRTWVQAHHHRSGWAWMETRHGLLRMLRPASAATHAEQPDDLLA